MSRPSPDASQGDSRTFESFEPRLAMSGHSVADVPLTQQILPGTELTGAIQSLQSTIDQAWQATINQIRDEYRFDGRGQTVAIIDSGIAWDHYALGNGYGAGHRVVGGWDFAENDANPYDDGPAGFHGTHVAGIVGSSDAAHRGVAPGVDLVALRVFDDQGNGSLAWLEQALQWVHQHRNSFVNPITTVNLSLGTSWNANNVPEWSTLEDEFAALRNDGIFVSVAAGNSFAQYNVPGVSYPAASPHVVPVASHDANGNPSSFSQRSSRSLFAPGENIRSTVPDHLFGGTQSGQYLSATGTSMAAPWVAGASALLRQAYQFMGEANVHQDVLYQRLVDSADRVFDTVTGGWYSRVNLQRAMEQVVRDTHGNNWESATSLGTVGGGMTVQGTITRVSDVDCFSFVAGRSGRMTLSFGTTHDLQIRVSLQGSGVQWSGNSVSFDVVAGQQYRFAVSTADGIGHYRMQAEISGTAVTANWGTVADFRQAGLQVRGTQTYQIAAGQGGILTVSGRCLSGSVNLQILDRNMQVLHSGSLPTAGSRIDLGVAAGEPLYVQLSGTGTADLRATNLVGLQNGQLTVRGTSGADRIQISTSGEWSVEVNGIHYRFAASTVQSLRVEGGRGHDELRLDLAAGNSNVHLGRHTISGTSAGRSLQAGGVEAIIVTASGTGNRMTLTGTDGTDRLAVEGAVTSMTGANYWNFATGFEDVVADGRGGADQALFNGSAADDQLGAGEGWAIHRSSGRTVSMGSVEQITFRGGGGNDLLNIHGAAGADQFTIGAARSTASVGSTTILATGVERSNVFSRGGADRVLFEDTAGNDVFVGNDRFTMIVSGGYTGYVEGVSGVSVTSTGGQDVAHLSGSSGNDRAWMNAASTTLVSGGQRIDVAGFQRVNLRAGAGGDDRVWITGTAGIDTVHAAQDATSVQGSWGSLNRALGFSTVNVDGWGGADTVTAVGSDGVDRLAATGDAISVTWSGNRMLNLKNVQQATFDGRGGADEVLFSQLGASDRLTGSGNQATALFGANWVRATNIAFLEAITRPGQSAAHSLAAVDYLFMLDGSWNAGP